MKKMFCDICEKQLTDEKPWVELRKGYFHSKEHFANGDAYRVDIGMFCGKTCMLKYLQEEMLDSL